MHVSQNFFREATSTSTCLEHREGLVVDYITCMHCAVLFDCCDRSMNAQCMQGVVPVEPSCRMGVLFETRTPGGLPTAKPTALTAVLATPTRGRDGWYLSCSINIDSCKLQVNFVDLGNTVGAVGVGFHVLGPIFFFELRQPDLVDGKKTAHESSTAEPASALILSTKCRRIQPRRASRQTSRKSIPANASAWPIFFRAKGWRKTSCGRTEATASGRCRREDTRTNPSPASAGDHYMASVQKKATPVSTSFTPYCASWEFPEKDVHETESRRQWCRDAVGVFRGTGDR